VPGTWPCGKEGEALSVYACLSGEAKPARGLIGSDLGAYLRWRMLPPLQPMPGGCVEAQRGCTKVAGDSSTSIFSRLRRASGRSSSSLMPPLLDHVIVMVTRLAQFGKEGKPDIIVPEISQETLAKIVGATRSGVSYFMNKFSRLGFIEYNGGMNIHSTLLNVILYDKTPESQRV
jgi:hypothetical protein